MLGKRIFLKITLILEKIMMRQQAQIHQSEVEKANVLRKVRILLGQNEAAFGRNVELPTEAIMAMEAADIPIPNSLWPRLSALVGIQHRDLMGSRLEQLMGDLDIGILSKTFPNISRSQIFDLINYYSLISQDEHKAKIFDVLKMLALTKEFPKSTTPKSIKKA